MEGDAKGQVGGVDARDDVRRDWARRSRGWKCDACCSGGKTSEEVLGEWREMCSGKGVSVDDEEGQAGTTTSQQSHAAPVPTGLRFGYKDEDGKVGDVDKEDQEKDTSSVHSSSDPSSQRLAAHRQGAGAGAATATSSDPSDPSSIPTPSASSTDTPPQPSQTTTTTTTPPSTQPSRTTPQPNTQTQTPVSRRSPQDTTAWMDGAIPILGVALILMVLKKWILPYLL